MIEDANLISQIKEFYAEHSIGDTQAQFNISRYKLLKLLEQYNIPMHTEKENQRLHQAIHGNGFQNKRDRLWQEFLESFNVNEFTEFYYTNGLQRTLEQYKLSKTQFNKIVKQFSIKTLTAQESKRINYIARYGSYETGEVIERQKSVSHTDYKAQAKKKVATNLQRYGCASPFGNETVKEKSKQTCLDKYGVDNVFKLKSMQEGIREIKVEKYGGLGFDTESLKNQCINTMTERYGVPWGCLTDNCMNASHGKNSKPNQLFEELLTSCQIEFEREFVLEQFRYDFKVGNKLIEINPSYTHSPDIQYKNSFQITPEYHQRKSNVATKYGYECIHVWDWDDKEKVLALLNDNQPVIYARKCTIKLVSKDIEKTFLEKYHLQGFVKSSIALGLFIGNDLVSIMTFGTPRYNKKYQYELLRYCSKAKVVGGAKKLFTHFLINYNPDSIISYCDKSKFTGDLYTTLHFDLLKTKLAPSKHWYNIKTNSHITNNLLKSQGFDRLLGKQYGTYGKGASNEELMYKHGYLTIYDAGQATYIWKKVTT